MVLLLMNIAWNFSTHYDLSGHVSVKEHFHLKKKNSFYECHGGDHIIHISAIPSILH